MEIFLNAAGRKRSNFFFSVGGVAQADEVLCARPLFGV